MQVLHPLALHAVRSTRTRTLFGVGNRRRQRSASDSERRLRLHSPAKSQVCAPAPLCAPPLPSGRRTWAHAHRHTIRFWVVYGSCVVTGTLYTRPSTRHNSYISYFWRKWFIFFPFHKDASNGLGQVRPQTPERRGSASGSAASTARLPVARSSRITPRARARSGSGAS